MYAKLPSMKSLIAFEAVARHQSVAGAAVELALTSSALSKQVQALEEQLGTRLFIRATRRIELTEQGKRLAVDIRDVLRTLQHSLSAVSPPAQHHELRLLAAPMFASYALMPKLSTFKAAHPDASFSFVSADANRIPDFDTEPLDGAFVFLQAPPEDEALQCIPVFQGCYLQPMCAPSLLGRRRMLTSVERMAEYPWLKNRKTTNFWQAWLCAAGAKHVQPKEVCWFDDSPSVLEAAAAGMGIAMIGAADTGPRYWKRLVPAHPFRLYDERANQYFIYPRRASNRYLPAFRDWLVREFNPAHTPRG
jgi:LysR family glycine cleavage system transcriptional activator